MLKIKKLKFYNLVLLYKYLAIRYKVFVIELDRPFFKHFKNLDFYCTHYILSLDNVVIGTLRINRNNDIAEELGRIALLPEYRFKGYGALAIKYIVNQIKQESKKDIIRLYTKNENISFYKKLDFFTA